MDSPGSIKVSLTESKAVGVTITLNEMAKALVTATKMDTKTVPIKYYINSINELGKEAPQEELQQLNAALELLNKLNSNTLITWPDLNTTWREAFSDFNLLSKVICWAYKLYFKEFHLIEREIPESAISIAIEQRANTAITKMAEPFAAITVVIDGKMYRLSDAIPAPDPVAVNLSQQQAAYKAAINTISAENQRSIQELQTQLDLITKGNRSIPSWWIVGDFYDINAMISLSPIYRDGLHNIHFYYPNTSIKFVSRGSVVKELKEPVPFPPLLVKAIVTGNRLDNAIAINLNDINSSFGSFHISSASVCTGDAKFKNLSCYADVKEWYSLMNRAVLQMCNLSSPFHPTYPPHVELYNKFFKGGIFTWPDKLFKNEGAVVDL